MKVRAWVSILVFGLAAMSMAQGPGPRGRGPGGPPDGGGFGRQNRPPMGPEGQRLARIVAAQATLKFSGERITVIRVGPTETRDIERIWQDSPRQRVEVMPGSTNAGQIIVTSGPRRRHYFPSRNEIVEKPSRLDNPLQRIMFLMQDGRRKVRVQPDGTREVAGIDASGLAVFDGKAPIARFWFDPKSLLVLRREMYDPGGRLIASMEYTRVNFTPRFDESDFVLNRPGATVIKIEDVLRAKSREAGVDLHMIQPNGAFRLDSVELIDAAGLKAVKQSYTSEIGRVTLFVMRERISPERVQRFANGLVASQVIRRGDDWLLLVGDIPPEQMDRLANTVR